MDTIPTTSHEPDLAALPEATRQGALERFRLLRPFLEDGVPLPALAREHHRSLRTLRAWVARYRAQGLAGLARHPRADRGVGRRLTPELEQFIIALAVQRPPATAAHIYRQVRPVAQARGWPTPSYRTVAAVIQRLDPALVTLAHGGTKAYKEAFDLLYRHEARAPNEVWQADHTLLDLWVLDERGQPARPWLTVVLDDYSRAVAGYSLSLHPPTALQTALALRQAIWHKGEARWHVCGIPAVFYTDHGPDFTSRHMEQVAADLKMRLLFSQKGEPRGRGKIERFFETVNQLFLCTVPGYTPPGAPRGTPTLTVPELDTRLHAFFVEDYLRRTHSETRMAPQERWEAGGFLLRLPESVEQLDLLLLTVAKTRRVQQDGIRFQGFRYIDLTLAAYVGEDVTIRYDPRDMAAIRIFHHDAFLCRAICQELAGQTISLADVIRARRRRRRALRGELRAHASVVDTYLAVREPAPPPAPPPPASEREQAVHTARLKRYYNE